MKLREKGESDIENGGQEREKAMNVFYSYILRGRAYNTFINSIS